MTIFASTPENIARAAQLLRDGHLVAFPTETVYGLGGDATCDPAVAGIYAAKGRPSFNPLIMHVAAPEALDELVIVSDAARRVIARFWPGPVTLVLPRAPHSSVGRLATAGLSTMAVRMPSHPVARALLKEVGRPIAAPSANTSGRLSPTTAELVERSLGANVAMILDGGPCKVGVESSVIDLTTDRPTLLRPGGLALEDLEACLGPLAFALEDEDAPKSPGMLLSHYAPAKPVRLGAQEVGPDEALLAFGPDAHIQGGTARLNLSPTGDLTEAAANLFCMLDELDAAPGERIAVMPIPMTGLGLAINDRLTRAAAPRD